MRKKIKLTEELLERMQNGDFIRVDGNVLCKKCQRKIYDHLEIEGCPTFIMDCQGKIVKV